MADLSKELRKLVASRGDRVVTLAMALLIFGLGYLAGLWTAETGEKTPIIFQDVKEGSQLVTQEDMDYMSGLFTNKEADNAEMQLRSRTEYPAPAAGNFVASINGKKYYYPDCYEVNRIKPENLISFSSALEARREGYEESACIERRGED